MSAAESDALRAQIRELTAKYYRATWDEQAPFVPGETRLAYGGRVFDEDELDLLVDSSLDFWLTNGRFGTLRGGAGRLPGCEALPPRELRVVGEPAGRSWRSPPRSSENGASGEGTRSSRWPPVSPPRSRRSCKTGPCRCSSTVLETAKQYAERRVSKKCYSFAVRLSRFNKADWISSVTSSILMHCSTYNPGTGLSSKAPTQ